MLEQKKLVELLQEKLESDPDLQIDFDDLMVGEVIGFDGFTIEHLGLHNHYYEDGNSLADKVYRINGELFIRWICSNSYCETYDQGPLVPAEEITQITYQEKE